MLNEIRYPIGLGISGLKNRQTKSLSGISIVFRCQKINNFKWGYTIPKISVDTVDKIH